MKNPLFLNLRANRVLRSGSWRYDAWQSHVFYRSKIFASYRDYDMGFRLFRSQERS